MRTRCLKCGDSHRTSDCPIKEKITNPICINCNKTGRMANWSQCEEFPKRKPKKVKRFTIVTLSKNQKLKNPPNRSHQISLLQPPSRALQIKIKFPELRPPPKMTNEKNNENFFRFNDVINELRGFFLDYPFLLEMGRQFGNARRRGD
ncbi:hypothetical protein TNCV_4492241 [Trichonephila clavipes]|nr:hypothetical protein TNCV_4492241 [Trichonephila clavipes]